MVLAYNVYILRSILTKGYYVGQTDDLNGRVIKHNAGEVKSTKPHRPWELVYREEYRTRSEAIRREREMKSRKSRKFIERLIFRDVAQPG